MTKERKYTMAEWREREDFRRHWFFFVECEPFNGSDTFPERMEAAGFIHLRRVRKSDLNNAFAAERGIESGGNLWEVTQKGRAVLDEVAQ